MTLLVRMLFLGNVELRVGTECQRDHAQTTFVSN
jgi:hypothetical protein